jgi:hypothetical protein
MQRKLIYCLILFSLVAAEGCRRGGAKREPISVNKEGDLIFSTKEDEFAQAARPKDAEKIVIEQNILGPYTPQQLDPKNNVTIREAVKDNAADQKAVSEAQKALQDARKVYLEKTNRENTAALAEVLIKYRQTIKPPGYSYDDLKKYLRRQKKYDMYNDVNSRAMEVPYLADSLNANHILCYHNSPESQPDPADAKKSIQYYPAVRTDSKFEMINKAELDRRIKTQELQVAYFHYVTYAAPHFYRQGSELDAFRQQLVRNGEPFFLPADPPASTGPVFFSKLQQRKPDLLKNPPEKRSVAYFKKYLKENAPPLLHEYVESGTLLIDVNVDLRTSGLLIACRSQPEPGVQDQFNQNKEKYHYGLNTDAQISSQYAASQLAGWMALRKTEQSPSGNMPGMGGPGGMPMPGGGMPPGGRPGMP